MGVYKEDLGCIMESECGIVKQVMGNYVVIEASAISFCSSCSNHDCSVRESRSRELVIKNTMGATVGDRVFFEISSKGIVLSSIVLYGLPLVFFITGILLGSLIKLPLLNDRDSAGILSGIIFLLISFVIMRIVSKYIVQHNTITPTMIKVEKLL